MTGRRLFIILILLFGLTTQASAASLPVILDLSPLASINSILSLLGGTLIDNIPGTNTYLVNLPLLPTATVAQLLGIKSIEVNKGVTLLRVPKPGVISVPPRTPVDWYK